MRFGWLVLIAALQLAAAQTEAAPPEPTTATLEDAIIHALGNHYGILEAKELYRQSRYRIEEERAALRPQVTLGSSVGLVHEEEPELTNSDRYGYGNTRIELSHSLYDGGVRRYRIDGVAWGSEGAFFEYRRELERTVMHTIEAYTQLHFASERTEIHSRNLERLEEILEIVTAKREAGAASRGDVSSIEASVSNARAALIQTRSGLHNTIAQYEYLLQEKADNLWPEGILFDLKLEPREVVLKRIEEENSLLQMTRVKIRAKQSEVSSQRAAYKPDIALSLSHQAEESWSGGDGRKDQTRFMLNLNHTLYDGNRRDAAHARLLSEVTGLRHRLEDDRRKLRWEATQLYNTLNSIDEAITNTQEEIRANRDMVETYWERFFQASQDLETLLQAQRQLNSAELTLNEQKQNRILDFFELKKHKGLLLDHFHIGL